MPVVQYTKEELYNKIRREILSLELIPGQRISEAEISKRLGVSRQPVREIFIHLSHEKLLQIVPQKGTFISLIDLEYVKQVIHMRYLIEKEILVEACDKLSEKTLMTLAHICDLQELIIKDEGDSNEFLALDNKFHRTIFEDSNHKVIWDIIESNNVNYSRFRLLDVLEKPAMGRIVEQHRTLLNHIKDKNTTAIQKMLKTHLFQGIEKSEHITEKYESYFV